MGNNLSKFFVLCDIISDNYIALNDILERPENHRNEEYAQLLRDDLLDVIKEIQELLLCIERELNDSNKLAKPQVNIPSNIVYPFI